MSFIETGYARLRAQTAAMSRSQRNATERLRVAMILNPMAPAQRLPVPTRVLIGQAVKAINTVSPGLSSFYQEAFDDRATATASGLNTIKAASADVGLRRGLLLTTAIAGMAMQIPAGAYAQTACEPTSCQYWDGGAATSGGVANGRGGDGTWNATSTNWTDAAGAVNTTWDRRGAVFAGTAGTVTVDGAQAFRELSFRTTGYRLLKGAAGALDLGANGARIFSRDATTTVIGVDIRGTGGFEIRGDGLIAFDGATIAPKVSIQQSRANFSSVTANDIDAVGSDMRLAGSTADHVAVFGLTRKGDIQDSKITTLAGQSADLSTNRVMIRGATDAARPIDSILVNNGSGRFDITNVATTLDTVFGIYGFNARIAITNTDVTTTGTQSTGIGVRSSRTDVTNARVTTSGAGSRAIVAAAGGTLNLTGVRVATLGGPDADGVGAYALATETLADPTALATLNATGVTVYTQGPQGIGAGTEGGTINLRGGTIVTGIRLNADGTPVTASVGAAAARAAAPTFIASGATQGIGAGALNGLITIDLYGDGKATSIETFGDAALGLGATGPKSGIIAKGATIATHGTLAPSEFGTVAAHAAAVANGATITITDSRLTTSGAFASGAFVLGTGTISLTGTAIDARSGALEIAPASGTTAPAGITATRSSLNGGDAVLLATFGGNDQTARFTIDGGSGASTAGKLVSVRRSSGVTRNVLQIFTSNGASLAGDIDALDGTTVTFSGGNADTGTMRLLSGRLLLYGALQSSALPVSPGATLAGGGGSVAGNVSIADGATLTGALTAGSLTLSNDSIVDVTFSAPLNRALFTVTNGLTLDGRLTVRDGSSQDSGNFGTGSYRLFDYGTLTANNGLVITNAPTGYNPGNFAIDLATPNQVNLIVARGTDTQYWDGANQAPGAVADGRGGAASGTRRTRTGPIRRARSTRHGQTAMPCSHRVESSTLRMPLSSKGGRTRPGSLSALARATL